MSLALVATGFAAWVLSNNAEKQENGAVEIAAVTESSISISDISFIKDNNDQVSEDTFIFEPLASDTLGRVRYDGTSEPENMDVKITWTIDNYQIVGDLFVDFKVPATVYDAVEAGYLALPAEFVEQGDTEIEGKSYKIFRYTIQSAAGTITGDGNKGDNILSYETTKDGDTVIAVTFTMNIAFSWGAEFDGLNPGIYYDNAYEDLTKGANIDYATVKDTLNTLKATIHGIDPEEYLELEEDAQKELCRENPVANYFVVINANVA